MLKHEERIRHALWRRNADINASFGVDGCKLLHARQRLDTALGLLGFGCLCLESVDEALQPGGFTGLTLPRYPRLTQSFCPLKDKALVASLVTHELALINMQNGLHHRIQKLGVV